MKITDINDGARIRITAPYRLDDYNRQLQIKFCGKLPDDTGREGVVVRIYHGRIGNVPCAEIKFDDCSHHDVITHSWIDGCFELI